MARALESNRRLYLTVLRSQLVQLALDGRRFFASVGPAKERDARFPLSLNRSPKSPLALQQIHIHPGVHGRTRLAQGIQETPGTPSFDHLQGPGAPIASWMPAIHR